MMFDPARVKSLFLRASDLPSLEERAAYLDRECRGEPDLRARVEALLEVEDRAGPIPETELAGALDLTRAQALEATQASGIRSERRISDPTTVGATGAQTQDGTIDEGTVVPPAPRPGAFVPGRVIGGRYTLLEILGEGGMGTVYRAEQSQPVKRRVALKLIKLGMDSRTVLVRFDAERQALALMDHPNIARVYDGGATDDHQPFFVMEFVDGVPITDYCDRHRLSVDGRLQLFVAVCQAVQHAHQKGIIHRDIKPSNVLVTEVDGRSTPKVIDFGVAKATEFRLTDQTLGDTGAIVGTPMYMSPEQADPSTRDIDTRTDIYALGVILYELLAGSPPLGALQFQRGAVLEMLRMVREVDPSKPSTKVSTSDALPSIAANRGVGPAYLKRALRGDLDWIVMKALAKDRTRRYETANGLGADILRHLASEPVLAAPPNRSYRLRKFVRKHRTGVIAASLVLLALLAGVAGTTWGLFEARRSAEAERLAKLDAQDKKALAEANEKKALVAAAEETKAKETAEAVVGFVESNIFAAAGPKGQDGGLGYDVKLIDAIQAALPAIAKDFPNNPLIEARLRMAIGRSFRYLGKSEVALREFEAARDLYGRAGGPEHPDTLVSVQHLAMCYMDLGRQAEALKLNEETLARMKARLGLDSRATLSAMNNLAASYEAAGRHAEALKLNEETLARLKAKLGADHPETLISMSNLAITYADLGRHAAAIELREQVLDLQKAKLGFDHRDTLWNMHNLANDYSAVGRQAEALKLREHVLALRKVKLGPDHPETLGTVNKLADSYLAVGRVRDALALLMEDSVTNPGASSRSLKLAALQAWFGRDEELAATRRRILAQADRTEDASTADLAAKTCSFLPSAGKADLDAALLLAHRAVDLGKDSEWLDFFLMGLGMAEYRSGHFAQAEATLAAALDHAKRHPHGAGKWTYFLTVTSTLYQAMSLFRLGKNDEARRLATETAAQMKPLPADERNPTAGEADHDDLVIWLAYKEAKALIGFDPTPVPAAPDAK